MSCSQLIYELKQSIWGCRAHLIIEGITYLGYGDEFP